MMDDDGRSCHCKAVVYELLDSWRLLKSIIGENENQGGKRPISRLYERCFEEKYLNGDSQLRQAMIDGARRHLEIIYPFLMDFFVFAFIFVLI